MDLGSVLVVRPYEQVVEQLHEALNLVDTRTDPQAREGFGQSATRLHHVITGARDKPYLWVAIDTARVVQLDL